ncbi:hypothetical protein GFER_06230 [Geoalkalibacter ferrihydriticus DSM 17813]|uniref:Uncharacterized protein n=1 Tax=Geoalkalibacter ferrihydriticus DSM 17813 TaxID=1121915 RepID=A0A0C2DTG3_9BACT|nr:hypothetical protein GFER_06230 [Geoalkalibacter ferrihydriticus DSM 17813]
MRRYNVFPVAAAPSERIWLLVAGIFAFALDLQGAAMALLVLPDLLAFHLVLRKAARCCLAGL